MPEQPHTRLHGRRLLMARIGWFLVFLIVAGMVVANGPHLLSDTWNEWQVGEAMPAARTLFSGTIAFARYVVTLKVIAALVFAGTALVLAWRQGDDWMVLFTSATLLLLVYLFGFSLDVETIRYPQFLEEHFPAVRAVVPTLMAASLICFFFLFPNGRFYPRWNISVALFAVVASATFFAIAASTDPYQGTYASLAPLPEEWGWRLFVYSLLGALVIGLISRVAYYHRVADTTERRQIKLVLVGLATIIVAALLQPLLESLNLLSYSWRHFIFLHVGLFIPIVLPLTIGISVLRYRLWDVDLLVNRALVYGVLTVLILILYGGSVGILSALLPGRTNVLIAFVAVGVSAVAAIPARRLFQNLVDKWFPAPSAPLPTQKDDITNAPPASFRWLLAHIVWVGLFAFLLWQLVVRLSEIPDILTATQTDYLVRTSLRLLPGSAAIPFVTYVTALRTGVTVVFWLTTIVIFWRRRSEWFALLVSFLLMLAPFALVLGGSEDNLLAFLSSMIVGAQLFLPFLFPDGSFIPRSVRWRVLLAGLLLLTPTIVYPIARLTRTDYGPGEWAYTAFMATMAVMMAAGLASQVYRYWRVADALQRQQMKWVLVGFGIAFLWVSWLVLWLGGILAWLNISEAVIALVMLHLTILASAALPLTIGFSILRYRLWQVDLVINRALVFAGLTLLVTMLYVFVVGVLGTLFQAGGNLLLSILATGLIAILFHPLRQRLQQTANRLMYGERDDPATVLSRLGKRLEETSVPTDILPALVETIAQTLKLPYVAIKVDQTVVASVGEVGNPSLHNYPLTYHSQPIGQLLVAPRAPGESFSSAELRLLKNIARQAGAVVYAYRLTRQLQRSRQRLVTTREEERRRLRRDLHDGLGPRLATLTLKVEAARNYLQREPQATDELLVELKGEIQEALLDVRRMAYALRPPALDQLGLAPALIEHASRSSVNGLKVVVEVPENLPPLPAAVEVAAYRIALEAMTNVVRHAQATRCTVRLALRDVLCLEIADDGLGLTDGSVPGVGLASMRERAAELGGSFALESTPQAGTRVTVCLPIGGNAS